MSDVPVGIVVGVDGSPSSRLAAQWAAQEAKARDLPVLLAAAYIVPQFLYAEGMVPSRAIFEELEEQAQGFIDEAAAAIREVNTEVELMQQLHEGSPISMLLELSKEADMVVIGSRGLGGVAGALLGSVSASLVGHAHCPVVVVRDDMDLAPERNCIVVGADGSPVSELAVQIAYQEADAHGAELVAVNAWLDRAVASSLAGLNLSNLDWEQAKAEQTQVVQEELEKYDDGYESVTPQIVIRRESPEMALAEVGKGARMIVVGSHGRGGFTGMLLGSTSRALLRLSPVPLMVVRERYVAN
ncbi:universal stress protein [Lawsonella clevelandensis]|uniref:Universal stress protein n=1 Tax=Lawsonella clevelandensis TaxID=1528099 RepID=A0A0M4LYZ4_9ACTN|nr:universal stress protein [Lawsonella clevelandensis]ALE19102.1 universal stress protein [Lawsonella clevelandensis]ALE34761.1 universal stress protein [Lawsonella clevelandensis]MDU7192922.1 universal stress protein [Lawsonella clevelandensis]VHO00904.1 Universal stress protein [Lawsonella clevelandensis]